MSRYEMKNGHRFFEKTAFGALPSLEFSESGFIVDNGTNTSQFGRGVAVDSTGSRIYASATSLGNTPGFAVYHDVAGVWTETYTQDNTGLDGHYQNGSFSDDGTKLIVGIPDEDAGGTRPRQGARGLYEYDVGSWSRTGNFSGPPNVNNTGQDDYGFTVRYSGDGVVYSIGRPGRDTGTQFDWGLAYIFAPGASQSKSNSDSRQNARFGEVIDVSYDGRIIALAQPSRGEEFGGNIDVYTANAGLTSWSRSDIIEDPALPNSFSDYRFGKAVSISSDGLDLAIAAKTPAGRIYIYKFITGSWVRQVAMDISVPFGANPNNHAAYLKMSGDKKYIISYNDGSGIISSYVLNNDTGIYDSIEDITVGTGHEVTMSTDGNTILVGDKDDGKGKVRIFTR